MKILTVIPARLQSQRLPRKVLLAESGKPLIQHVWERVKQIPELTEIAIATDSTEVFEACTSFGALAVMTSDSHTSGTDRVAEAADILESQGHVFDYVINVQGDEPLLNPEHIHALIAALKTGDPMASLCEELSPADSDLPQVVKVVLNLRNQALYFSRSVIPYPRNSEPQLCYRHVGIYGFSRKFLRQFTNLSPAPLEMIEGLEQLRALYHGFQIRMGVVKEKSGRGIDTREDYDAFLAELASDSNHSSSND